MNINKEDYNLLEQMNSGEAFDANIIVNLYCRLIKNVNICQSCQSQVAGLKTKLVDFYLKHKDSLILQ